MARAGEMRSRTRGRAKTVARLTPKERAASDTRHPSLKTLFTSVRRLFGFVRAFACKFIPGSSFGEWVGFATPTIRGVRDVYDLLISNN